MARKIEEMELRKVHEVQAISEPQQPANPCSICQSFEHMVEECPTIPAVREMFGEQANLIGQWKPNSNAPYGNTYNSSWRNHPNFAWKPRPNPYQSPAQSSQQSQGQSSVEQALVSLSKVMGDFVSEQKSINSQLNQKIDNVESTLNKKIDGMYNELSQKIDNIQYSISRLTNLNTVNEKGKFPSQPHQNPKGIHEVESKDEDSSKHDEEAHAPPFPQALRGKKPIKNASEILDVLRQVKVNIPLLDMIKQVPTYAKFLKDLCTVKRGLNVTKQAFLTEQELGLGELKSTSITLSLADRSVKIPRGNGVMQLTFGNMTLELNIFHLCQKHIHPEEDEGPEEFEENPNESHEDLDDGLAEPMGMNAVMSNWRQKPVILPLFKDEEEMKEAKDEILKLELKTLPSELKYAYLEKAIKTRCAWVSPTQVVPKKSGITVVKGENGMKCPHASQLSLREYLGILFYCFLDGYSGYFQIEIDVEDQEKTTFTCPFGTYAYRRMPFGLCNTPATFQRCMLSIFSDMVERIMEVFMDDITVYGTSFEDCLSHLEDVLKDA
ncbi:Retrovirus-related Pol polyprotein from transposon 297 [Vitis vinifera]|uniref:Retrovirus-related Pol polyprotein from transposon 297 n=1 Tax=Vitis vinifera TaxID=29760 RepID=A0A438G3Q9_VITVI|nr:Retrovirus-related Pol polyprotein from transposon 297 [Vitis vinifera]